MPLQRVDISNQNNNDEIYDADVDEEVDDNEILDNNNFKIMIRLFLITFKIIKF